MTSGFKADLPRFRAAPDATAAALAWPLFHRPGTVWCYEQATAQALVPIITRITGQQPLDLLEPRVLGPLGTSGVGWLRSREGGDCLGWRSVLITARDLCLFGELLLRGGRWNDRALLDASFVARMTAVSPVTAGASVDLRRDEHRRRNYGFLAYVNAHGLWPGVDPGAFALLGAFGNACLVDPRHDLVFVRLVTPRGSTQRGRLVRRGPLRERAGHHRPRHRQAVAGGARGIRAREPDGRAAASHRACPPRRDGAPARPRACQRRVPLSPSSSS